MSEASLKKLINYIKLFHTNLNLYEKFYFYSLSFFIFLTFTTGFASKNFHFYTNILVSACLIGFGFGFAIYLHKFYAQLKEYQFIKLGFIVINAIFLLLTAMASQNFIAITLGLPPQDFNLTFGLISLVLYPVVVLMISSVILLLISIYYLFALVVSGYKNQSFKIFTLKLCHFLGALGLVFLINFIPAYIGKNENELGSLIRWFAFYSDYQVLKNYPDLPVNTRVRLHENGIYSTAITKDGEVKIQVYKYEVKNK